ncbi:MAG: serine/threonine-protein kinase [Verrucomicrobiota bacterium]|nr:serine/threonine-protein kinase [Verrucomicrobiota bacterium]
MRDQGAERVAHLVKSAVELGPETRAAFLDEECGSDPKLRAEIESLLEEDAGASQFLEVPALHLAAESLVLEGAFHAGQSIGDYEIVSLLGSGGMGDVYLAEERELHRRVALKFVRRGMASGEMIRHFKREEHLLASLNHPNIAQLYRSGVSAEGAPFFAMEYVEGQQLDDYCEKRGVATKERLQLFRKVCSAVTYAHQHLVIHRDLKPANIRVTPEGEPKLLDFGIAKLLDSEEGQPGGQSLTLQGVMTPEYASPEQIAGGNITTASDVYSLGVLLYKLLTGQSPYRTETNRPQEIVRAIADQEPERPSTATRKTGRSVSSIPPRSVPDSRSLRGDLDNIILMAMRKEPARRYESVAQFSEDVRCHLEGLPVIARRDTMAYRTTKFVGRNKVAVAAAVVIFLTLIGGILATTWQAKRAMVQAQIAAEQRDRAQRLAAKAERVTTFLQNVLGFSDPGWASSNPQRKRDATIEEALAEAARRAEVELANEPEALASVHFTIGTSYRVQSRFAEAEPHLRKALEIRRRILGPANLETAQGMVALAEWCVLNARHPEADALFREAIPVFRTAHDVKWLTIALNDYGVLKSALGENQAAEKLLREGLLISDALFGADRAPRAIMYSVLGAARRDQGDLVEGAELTEKAIDEFRALPGEPRSEMAFALQNLASIRQLQGDFDRAESLLRESFELFRKSLGENHQSSAYPLMTLAEVYYRREKYENARSEIEHAMQIQRAVLPVDHIDLAWSRLMLAKILMRTGAAGEAETTLRSVLARLEQTLPNDHPGIAAARGALGECLVIQSRFAEAEPLLVESYKIFQTRVGSTDPRTQSARACLLKLYQAWGKLDEAGKYRL